MRMKNNTRIKKSPNGVVLCRDRIAYYCQGEVGNASDQQDLLDRMIPGSHVVVALDPSQDFFFSSREDGEGARRLLEHLEKQYPEGLLEDEFPPPPRTPGIHCVLAFPKDRVRGILDALHSAGAKKVSVVSGTHVLLHAAQELSAAPRGWKTSIRVFPGQGQGMALLIHRGVPVARQIFPAEDGNCSAMAICAFRSLSAQAVELLGSQAVDGLILHTGEQGDDAISECAAALAIPTRVVERLDCTPESLAVLLANCKPGSRRGVQDLALKLVEKKSEGIHFPLVPALPAIVVLCLSAGYLYVIGSTEAAEAARLKHEVEETVARSGIEAATLADTLDELSLEVSIAQSFLERRTYWSEFLKAVPDLVPDAMTMTQISGRYPLLIIEASDLERAKDQNGEGEKTEVGYARGQRFLALDLKVPTGGGASPPEVPVLSAALQSSPPFERWFPEINGASVQALKGEGGAEAKVSILCMPRGS